MMSLPVFFQTQMQLGIKINVHFSPSSSQHNQDLCRLNRILNFNSEFDFVADGKLHLVT